MYSIGMIVFSPLFGKIVDRFGHKNLFSFGIGLMGISFICFGYISEMERRTNILALVIIVRFLQGSAGAALITTYYTVVMNDYAE